MSKTFETVPFGKYKNQSITKLMADTNYINWLKNQPWFENKYKDVYNIVVLNNFQNEDQPTPEHNKIQANFLEKNFCEKFAKLFINKTNCEFRSTFEPNDGMDINLRIHKSYNNQITQITNQSISDLKQHIFGDVNFKTAKEANDYADSTLTAFKQKMNNSCINNHLSFWIDHNNNICLSVIHDFYVKYKIEIKPILGDDYPCVLRKMKRQIQFIRQKHCGTNPYDNIILLVDKFDSKAVTKKQLINMFQHENIKVVFMKDIK